jgi:flagellar biosynthesis protein FliR
MEAIPDNVVTFAIATMLVSFRIAPTLASAPPFTLIRIPAIVRLSLALGLSAFMVIANPQSTTERLANESDLLAYAATELFLGIALALALHIAFGAISTAGRIVDIQAGFGLALLADPSLKGQMPLVGTLFTYLAAAVFFATSGPGDLITIWSASLSAIPLGSALPAFDLPVLLGYFSAVTGLALGLAGLLLLVLFLIDLAVAFMSKTLPQMNVLLLGFQVKTLALLIVLPIAIAASLSIYLRLVRMALDATPAWL